MQAYDADWQAFEQAHVWHPYAAMPATLAPYAVRSAAGVHLTLHNDRKLVDGMASWWCAIHGYAVPELDAAIRAQLDDMAHVMFGGLTHQPAAKLAARLLDMAPSTMQKVFFADSGSVSVEVAMKMAVQYWRTQGMPKKQKMLAIRNGYHGDTFGAMSVCDPENGMHHWFSGMLPQQYFIDSPATVGCEAALIQLRQSLTKHGEDIAALILEPLVQGAGGMRFYDANFLSEARRLCDAFDVLLIADEIATGFGRTGTMFACEQAQIEPDIMCVGKALTGGYMTLAAVLVTDKVCDGIHADGSGVLMHGPTFMANPLACAVADASLALLQASPWQVRVQTMEYHFQQTLEPCRDLAAVADVRVKGAIGVLEMHAAMDVGKVQDMLVERGVWLRPYGKLLYAMPPFVMREKELTQLSAAMCDVAEALSA